MVPIGVITWNTDFTTDHFSLTHITSFFRLPYSKLSSQVKPQFPTEKQQQQHPQRPQQSEGESIKKCALGGSYNSIFSSRPLVQQYRTLLSGGTLHRRRSPYFRGGQVELTSTGTGESSVVSQHRRVQTRSESGSMAQQEADAIIDTHSADGVGNSGSASPGADSGVFSSSTDCHEVIQKDIGYSSDADMSDAIEVSCFFFYYQKCSSVLSASLFGR